MRESTTWPCKRSTPDRSPTRPHYLDADVDELIDLREQLLEAGHSEGTANGLIGWLVAKRGARARGRAGQTPSLATQAKYRRILRELDEGGDDSGQAAARSKPAPSSGSGGVAKTRKPKTRTTDGRKPIRPAAENQPGLAPQEAGERPNGSGPTFTANRPESPLHAGYDELAARRRAEGDEITRKAA